MKRVKLVSGGVDSCIMSQLYDGTNVYVDFGQPYVKEELNALENLGIEYDLIKVDSKFKCDEKSYINDRNLFLSSLMCLVYSPDVIMLGGTKDDCYADNTPKEYRRIERLVSRYCSHPVKVVSPFWKKGKADIVREFPDKSLVAKTFSCYHPVNGRPCGNCIACLRRAIALENSGVPSGVEISRGIIEEYSKNKLSSSQRKELQDWLKVKNEDTIRR